MNDVRKMIYVTLVGFLLFLVFWFSIVYISACGFTLTCNQASPLVIRTPIPTLIPHSRSGSQAAEEMTEFNKCQVAATDLIGAWVSAGSPETEVFPFSDVNGEPCEGMFEEDVHPLFVENSLWYPGAIGCVSCHNPDQPDRNAGLDLTSYETISSGTDIFGGDDWQNSLLHDVLVNQKLVPEGHSKESPGDLVFVYAGHSVSEVAVTATPTP
jgi:hypothetical protein